MESNKISGLQFFMLIVMFVTSSSMILIPAILIEHSKQDAWLAGLIALIVSLPVLWLYCHLGDKHSSQTMVEYGISLLGKPAGIVAAVLYIFYYILICSALLLQTGNLLVALIYPETPIEILNLTFFLVVIWAVRLRLETFARAAEVLFPWVILFLFLLVISLLPEMRIRNILPIMEHGAGPLAKGALSYISIPVLDLVVFLMIYPHVNSGNRKKWFITGALLSGVIVLLFTFLSVAVLGAAIAQKQIYPFYTLAEKVNIGHFIQRIEVLVGGVWIISLFFKLSVCFHALVTASSQLLKVKSRSAVIYPLGLIVLIYSIDILPSNIAYRMFAANYWPMIMLFYGVFIPLIYWGAGAVKSRKRVKAKPQ